jgi:hypothetical protein
MTNVEAYKVYAAFGIKGLYLNIRTVAVRSAAVTSRKYYHRCVTCHCGR